MKNQRIIIAGTAIAVIAIIFLITLPRILIRTRHADAIRTAEQFCNRIDQLERSISWRCDPYSGLNGYFVHGQFTSREGKALAESLKIESANVIIHFASERAVIWMKFRKKPIFDIEGKLSAECGVESNVPLEYVLEYARYKRPTGLFSSLGFGYIFSEDQIRAFLEDPEGAIRSIESRITYEVKQGSRCWDLMTVLDRDRARSDYFQRTEEEIERIIGLIRQGSEDTQE